MTPCFLAIASLTWVSRINLLSTVAKYLLFVETSSSIRAINGRDADSFALPIPMTIAP